MLPPGESLVSKKEGWVPGGLVREAPAQERETQEPVQDLKTPAAKRLQHACPQGRA
jgi:hypothetical protein